MSDLLQQFLASEQGNAAVQHLQTEHGLSPSDAQSALAATAQTVQSHAQGTPEGLEGLANQLGGGGNALLGALGGLLTGGGMSGMAQGAVGSVIAGKAGEAIGRRMGMNPATANTVAAAALPFLLHFLRTRAQGGAGAPVPGATPPPSVPSAKPGASPPGGKQQAGQGPAQGGPSGTPEAKPGWKRIL